MAERNTAVVAVVVCVGLSVAVLAPVAGEGRLAEEVVVAAGGQPAAELAQEGVRGRVAVGVAGGGMSGQMVEGRLRQGGGIVGGIGLR